MIIRLETVDYLGDTEVIVLKTIANEEMRLGNCENGTVQLVYDLSNVPELQFNP